MQRFDRRDFLRLTGGAAIAGGTGYALLSALGCAGTPAVPATGGAWNVLRRRLHGRLVLPGDAGFAGLALPNNLRYAKILPRGIALCANADDVAASILWARENGVPIVARSGGHSYGGYSTTTGLMIDLRNMNAVTFDAATGKLTLEGGARNGDVFAACRNLGVAITHGRCSGVGVAGLALGGGIGFNMRANGLTCDQLVDGAIVTADGRLRDLHENGGDLLWASRGAGGGNFGINTSLTFQTFAVSTLTIFDLHWVAKLDEVFFTLATVLESAPPDLGCRVSVALSSHPNGREMTVQLLGQFGGTPAQLRDILAPVYAVAPPASGFIKRAAYWPAQELLSEVGPPEYYHERSRFFDEAISSDLTVTVFSWLQRWPATVERAAFKMFQTAGRVNAVAPGATAFVHRSSRWLAAISLNWEAHSAEADVRANLDWQTAFYRAVAPRAGGGAYQNFIDPALKGWKTAYYGANLARLETIKRHVDPTHVFNFEQAIP